MTARDLLYIAIVLVPAPAVAVIALVKSKHLGLVPSVFAMAVASVTVEIGSFFFLRLLLDALR